MWKVVPSSFHRLENFHRDQKLVTYSSYRSLYHLHIILSTSQFTRRRLHMIHWKSGGRTCLEGSKGKYIFITILLMIFFIVIFKELYVTNTRFSIFSCFVVYRSLSFEFFNVWWMEVLPFGGYVGFFQSLQCNSVRGSGGPLHDNGALFEFGRDLLLSTSKIVSLRLERWSIDLCLIQIAF